MISAFLAGGINSVAGGGTLVTFPSLIALGLPSIAANATSTVAIWPGSLGSMWGFRREIREINPRFLLLAIPSVIGGLVGALLLRRTPAALFDHLVPFLILFATVLFSVQAPIQRRLQTTPHHEGKRSTTWVLCATLAQFMVGIYGGYFGAGMSIMMLTVLAFMGMEDILKMSALTSFLGFCTNGVASILFAVSHMVVWVYVLAMMFAALFGGYAAAGIARRIGRVAVRRFVISVGFTIAVALFIKMH
ncbi:MAG: sulfite exporter TauE/SafE family protein [Acidobacteria bacterium]|nr:MAG: sulfite exporter TauE/SafE family protein [Acidobacteriota bacterium]